MSREHPTIQSDPPGKVIVRSGMSPRSPDQAHRSATPLELFFDLVFVVAVAQAASGLHHAVAGGHAFDGVVAFLMVFFAIWWAWLNFTWFASAYDCDDGPYRIAAFVQMAGALLLAASIPAMFETGTPNAATVFGYVIIRLALVSQWLRASAGDPVRRVTAYRYAACISGLQVAWVAMLFIPQLWAPGFVVLAALEMAAPVWAERAAPTTWHPHHIAERYGLFTIIVLGESVLAATMAVQAAWSGGTAVASLLPLIVGGLLIVCSMWWLYFDRPVHDLLSSFGRAIRWGYGHYVVFASAAAVGAGLAVAVDGASDHADLPHVVTGAAVAVPVVVYVAALWILHDRPEYRRTRPLGAIAGVAVLLTIFTTQAVLLTGIILTALVAAKARLVRRE